jgi:hypothetical protein
VAKKKMTCMSCGRTLRRRACPVHGKAGMAPAAAVKATLAANAAVKAASGPSFLAKNAAPRPQTAEDVRRERLKRAMIDPDPMKVNVAYYELHPEFTPPWGRS